MGFRIAASMASAPMERLAQVVAELEAAQVDIIHFDIEDGSFVPMMTLGTKIIADLRALTQRPFDVHLMMVHPEWILEDLVRWGVQRISVHYEACPYPRKILRRIASLGAEAGLAFNPATPLPDLHYLLPYLSFVVILTTEPEYPDAPFLPPILRKVRLGKDDAALNGVEWVVDGGITPDNLPLVLQAGADTVVVGRAVFKNGEIQRNIQSLRAAIA
jgi:ribulose-phosphate 3-epimerase